ncbi:hypothetical protein ACIRNI_28525 [Streptomyces sp. NPDC093546]|uniref:hypothetical protein n=1 Tax=Streptomyces sp. NPDC093546 TaxID=3366040 RepID=UPI0037FEF8FD
MPGLLGVRHAAEAGHRAVAAAVDAAMSGASEDERRAAVEHQLHQDVSAEAWAKARRREEIPTAAEAAALCRARAERAARQART